MGLETLQADVIPAAWPYVKVLAYLAADNELARLGDADQEQLAILACEIADSDKDLAILAAGSEKALEALKFLAAEAQGIEDPGTQLDMADELQQKWQTELGQIWSIPSKASVGCHRLLCGDCTQTEVVEQLLSGVSPPTLLVTDPPYGVEYDPTWRHAVGKNDNPNKMGLVTNDNRANWQAAWELFPGDVAYIWHASRRASEVQMGIEAAGFVIVVQIIWAKDHPILSRGDYHYQHEPCWYAVRKGMNHAWAGSRKQCSVWNIPCADDSGHGHSTQKPVECMARPIRNHTAKIIYDPFVGSGTTLVACEQLGRLGYGVEIEPRYIAVCLERLSEMGLEPQLLLQEA